MEVFGTYIKTTRLRRVPQTVQIYFESLNIFINSQIKRNNRFYVSISLPNLKIAFSQLIPFENRNLSSTTREILILYQLNLENHEGIVTNLILTHPKFGLQT